MIGPIGVFAATTQKPEKLSFSGKLRKLYGTVMAVNEKHFIFMRTFIWSLPSTMLPVQRGETCTSRKSGSRHRAHASRGARPARAGSRVHAIVHMRRSGAKQPPRSDPGSSGASVAKYLPLPLGLRDGL
eukprot:593350-Prymnesium_polylepis.1